MLVAWAVSSIVIRCAFNAAPTSWAEGWAAQPGRCRDPLLHERPALVYQGLLVAEDEDSSGHDHREIDPQSR